MALSGSLNSTAYDGRYIQFSWTATQDVINNKSTISWTLKGAGYGSVAWYNAGNFKVVIDGATVYSTGESNRITLYNGTTVASGTKVINHNSDGSRKFKVAIQAGIYTYAVNCTGETEFTLDTIPRASTVGVSSMSVDMGTAVTFTITRASTAFKHKLTYAFAGKTGTIGSDIALSKTWTIPLSLADNIPNNTSNNCVITCITYNGSTEIGRDTLGMTLKVPSSVKPSISDVVVSEAVSGLASKFGVFVQNKSKLKVAVSASGAYSSTIKTYAAEILNKTYTAQLNYVFSNVIDVSGSVDVVVTVTDSRGRTDTKTVTVAVAAYSDPTITAFTVERCTGDGTLDDEGEYVKIVYGYNIASVNGKNDKSYTVAYKRKEDADFTTLTSVASYAENTTYIPAVLFSGDNSYDFIMTVTDYFKSVSYIADIPTAFTLMDYHSSGTGLAIGKVSQKPDTLEIALDVEFMGNVRGAIFDAIYPVGSIYLAYNHINPADLFGGTWERIENAFLWASTASDTIGVTGGEKTHTLTVNEMPRHKHNVGAYKSTDGNGSVLDSYTALVGTSNGADTTSKYYTSGTLSTGGSQPHNNMPPYIQVSAWRRTA